MLKFLNFLKSKKALINTMGAAGSGLIALAGVYFMVFPAKLEADLNLASGPMLSTDGKKLLLTVDNAGDKVAYINAVSVMYSGKASIQKCTIPTDAKDSTIAGLSSESLSLDWKRCSQFPRPLSVDLSGYLTSTEKKKEGGFSPLCKLSIEYTKQGSPGKEYMPEVTFYCEDDSINSSLTAIYYYADNWTIIYDKYGMTVMQNGEVLHGGNVIAGVEKSFVIGSKKAGLCWAFECGMSFP